MNKYMKKIYELQEEGVPPQEIEHMILHGDIYEYELTNRYKRPGLTFGIMRHYDIIETYHPGFFDRKHGEFDGENIHHRDFNKLNDSYENLVIMFADIHAWYHYQSNFPEHYWHELEVFMRGKRTDRMNQMAMFGNDVRCYMKELVEIGRYKGSKDVWVNVKSKNLENFYWMLDDKPMKFNQDQETLRIVKQVRMSRER